MSMEYEICAVRDVQFCDRIKQYLGFINPSSGILQWRRFLCCTLKLHGLSANFALCESMLETVMSYPVKTTSVLVSRNLGIQFMSPQEESSRVTVSWPSSALTWSMTRPRMCFMEMVAAVVLPSPLRDSPSCCLTTHTKC